MNGKAVLKRSIELTVSGKELADLFWGCDSTQQAAFFERLACHRYTGSRSVKRFDEHMVEWSGVVAGILTVVSVVITVMRWREQRSGIITLTGGEAVIYIMWIVSAFNFMFWLAVWCIKRHD